MHDLLKTSIIQSLEDEKKVNASVRKKITDEIALDNINDFENCIQK